MESYSIKPEKNNGEKEQSEADRVLSSAIPFEEFRRSIEKQLGETQAVKMETFEALDNSFDISNEGKYGLVGVIGGVKQATEFLVYAKDGEEAQKSDETKTLLDGLGLKYSKEVE